MAHRLVVREPFENYAKGDEITDPDAVEFILASDYEQNVIKTAVIDTKTAGEE